MASRHVAPLDREVGLQITSRHGGRRGAGLNRQRGAPKFGADGARLVEHFVGACAQRRQRQPGRRLERSVERPRQQPVDLREPHLGLGGLLDDALFDARHLRLDAQHIGLGALSDGISGARHDLNLL
jgi:hypothetical protein